MGFSFYSYLKIIVRKKISISNENKCFKYFFIFNNIIDNNGYKNVMSYFVVL